jgi:hypothetical protein
LFLWPQSTSPTAAKGAEEHEHKRPSTQGGAHFQRACPGLVCLAPSALLSLRGDECRKGKRLCCFAEAQCAMKNS